MYNRSCVIHVVTSGFLFWFKSCVSCPSAFAPLGAFPAWLADLFPSLLSPCFIFLCWFSWSPPSFFLPVCMRSSCLVRGLRLGVDGRPAAVIQHWVHCLGVGRRGGGGSSGLYPSLSICHTSTHRHTKRRWSHHVEPCSLNTQTSSSFVSPPSFPLPCCSVWRKRLTFRVSHSHASLPCGSERPVLVRAVAYCRVVIRLLFRFVKCHLSR